MARNIDADQIGYGERIKIRPLFARFHGFLVVALLHLSFSSTAADVVAPLGLPDVPSQFRSVNQGRAALGRELFFDRRLSADGTISCTSCHRPEHNLTDRRALAVGIGGQVGTRNAPSLYNVAFATSLFWDGRSTDLESQAVLPLLNAREHGLASEKAVLAILDSDRRYRKEFARVFGQPHVSIDAVAAALAAYERTLLAGDSPFDRYVYGGDPRAMSPAAIRGLSFFRGRAGCATCHTIDKTSALLTDQEFHSSPKGLPESVNSALVELTGRVIQVQEPNALNSMVVGDSDIASLGRYVVTRNPKDIGLFKTPSLRNVTTTGPYLHDGSVESLQEVVELELYSRGDAVRSPIVATVEERADLVEFLTALSSSWTN